MVQHLTKNDAAGGAVILVDLPAGSLLDTSRHLERSVQNYKHCNPLHRNARAPACVSRNSGSRLRLLISSKDLRLARLYQIALACRI